MARFPQNHHSYFQAIQFTKRAHLLHIYASVLKLVFQNRKEIKKKSRRMPNEERGKQCRVREIDVLSIVEEDEGEDPKGESDEIDEK